MRAEPYFDPLGETEPYTTPYQLTAYKPPRPPPNWLPKIFTQESVTITNTGTAYRICPDDTNQNLDCFEFKHLDSIPKKSIVIKSMWFPLAFRCSHIYAKPEKHGCDLGCYFLERGQNRAMRWRCTSIDCEGHVYCGRVKRAEDGVACFGEKGRRMVLLSLPGS